MGEDGKINCNSHTNERGGRKFSPGLSIIFFVVIVFVLFLSIVLFHPKYATAVSCRWTDLWLLVVNITGTICFDPAQIASTNITDK